MNTLPEIKLVSDDTILGRIVAAQEAIKATDCSQDDKTALSVELLIQSINAVDIIDGDVTAQALSLFRVVANDQKAEFCKYSKKSEEYKAFRRLVLKKYLIPAGKGGKLILPTSGKNPEFDRVAQRINRLPWEQSEVPLSDTITEKQRLAFLRALCKVAIYSKVDPALLKGFRFNSEELSTEIPEAQKEIESAKKADEEKAAKKK